MPEKNESYPLRVVMLIASPKLVDKAEKLFHAEGAPVLHRCHAVGTANSEMQDILGLGGVDKSMLIATLPQPAAEGMLRILYKALHLGQPGSGIVCTLPLTGANAVLFRMLAPMNRTESSKKSSGKKSIEK